MFFRLVRYDCLCRPAPRMRRDAGRQPPSAYKDGDAFCTLAQRARNHPTPHNQRPRLATFGLASPPSRCNPAIGGGTWRGHRGRRRTSCTRRKTNGDRRLPRKTATQRNPRNRRKPEVEAGLHPQALLWFSPPSPVSLRSSSLAPCPCAPPCPWVLQPASLCFCIRSTHLTPSSDLVGGWGVRVVPYFGIVIYTLLCKVRYDCAVWSTPRLPVDRAGSDRRGGGGGRGGDGAKEGVAGIRRGPTPHAARGGRGAGSRA